MLAAGFDLVDRRHCHARLGALAGPAEVLERIFEPYFTTREGSGGTGLGLSNSFALVSDAGGVMRVRSEEGHGTAFQIVLPSVSRAR